MQEGVQVPLVAHFPDRHLREKLRHGMPALLKHLKRLHIQASLGEITLGHGMTFPLLAAFRQKPLMAHTGDLEIQLGGPIQQPPVPRDFFRVGRRGIDQQLGQVHPTAVGAAAQALDKIQISRRVDPLIPLSLNERFTYAVKALMHPSVLRSHRSRCAGRPPHPHPRRRTGCNGDMAQGPYCRCRRLEPCGRA